jgi:hypothetical protein
MIKLQASKDIIAQEQRMIEENTVKKEVIDECKKTNENDVLLNCREELENITTET